MKTGLIIAALAALGVIGIRAGAKVSGDNVALAMGPSYPDAGPVSQGGDVGRKRSTQSDQEDPYRRLRKLPLEPDIYGADLSSTPEGFVNTQDPGQAFQPSSIDTPGYQVQQPASPTSPLSSTATGPATVDVGASQPIPTTQIGTSQSMPVVTPSGQVSIPTPTLEQGTFLVPGSGGAKVS